MYLKIKTWRESSWYAWGFTVAAEETLSWVSGTSEERDFTKLRKGFSLEGKLKDLVGEELENKPFCSAIHLDRVPVGELTLWCLDTGESLDVSGMTATLAAESVGTPSNICSLASTAVTIFEASCTVEVVATDVMYSSSSSSSSSSFPKAEKWIVMLSFDSDRCTWSLGPTAGCCLSVELTLSAWPRCRLVTCSTPTESAVCKKGQGVTLN